MAWTTPKENFASLEVLTAAAMNQIGANLSYLKTQVDAAAANIAAQIQVPLGAVMDWPYAFGNIPTWALLPVGQAISRTTYSGLNALAQAAAYPHGAGDGSTTFTLPDMRGRVLAALDNMGGSTAGRITAAISGAAGTTLGAVFGAEGIALVTAQIPAHNHSPMGGTLANSGTGLTINSAGAGLYSSDGGANTTYLSYTNIGATNGRNAGHTHLIYAMRSGGGYGLSTANAGFKENVAVAWATGGVDVSYQSPGESVDHAHSITDQVHRHSWTDPGHAHGITDAGHTHGLNTLLPATYGTGTLNAGPATTYVRTMAPMILVNKFMRAL